MRYFIIDDDSAIRAMLIEIIEEEDLGEVVGEAEDGSMVDSDFLTLKKVDIVLVDLLMPIQDGLETIKRLIPHFNGKFVMISQVETKELIGKAYVLGIEYYITKPLNRLEITGILKKVKERMLLEKSLLGIQESLNLITKTKELPYPKKSSKQLLKAGNYLLSDLGMIAESGSKDLLDILEILYEQEQSSQYHFTFPTLKQLYDDLATLHLPIQVTESELQKERKASEQRIRRAVYQGLSRVASLGLTDFLNPKFEAYASKFFDFPEVRKKMLELQGKTEHLQYRVNIKKFIQVLYIEAKHLIG